MGKANLIRRVCLIPNVSGVGGMVSFRSKLAAGLAKRGIEVSYNLADTPYDVILLIGGTHDLAGLFRARLQGIPVIQRLDGLNWIHRKRWTGWRHFLRAEYGNFILSLIRSRLADRIVYQSGFSRQWWERVYGLTCLPWQVVYNGVDLDRYSPLGPKNPPIDHDRILLVEGSLGGGYEIGFETAVRLAERLNIAHSRSVEVMVVGQVLSSLQENWKEKTKVPLIFTGRVPLESIPELDRSAHVLFAADLNPACPNSAIEAMACGLPVVSFDTGSLAELVTGDAGRVVPYGGDPWKLDSPDTDGLARATDEVLRNQPRFRTAARKRAEDSFGLEKMVDGYLEVMAL
jgi:glycosyltransferase involved in cell wall biosynthesis